MKLLNLFLSLLGSKVQLAASNPQWHSRWLSHPQPTLPLHIKRHQALKCLQLLHPSIEEIPQTLCPRITLSGELPELSHLPSRYIVASVSNNRTQNRLPPERQAWLLNELCLRHDLTAVISALPQDRGRADAVIAGLRCPSTAVVSESLHTLLHLLSRCTVAFSAEGGFMHLAASLDRPQTVLFTTTLPAEWAPLSNKAICLHSPTGLTDISDTAILAALEEGVRSREPGEKLRAPGQA